MRGSARYQARPRRIGRFPKTRAWSIARFHPYILFLFCSYFGIGFLSIGALAVDQRFDRPQSQRRPSTRAGQRGRHAHGDHRRRAPQRPRRGFERLGRYEAEARIPFDDGWQSLDELPPFKTVEREERARKIITRNQSPDLGFDRSINPYRGCEHGCIYCFARPTHAYHGMSAGLDFETQLFVKPDAPELASQGAGRAANIRAAHDRHGHEHRPLSADRAQVETYAPHSRSAARRQSSRSAS
jgi:hypothetical protein